MCNIVGVQILERRQCLVNNVGCLFFSQNSCSLHALVQFLVSHQFLKDVQISIVEEIPIRLNNVRVVHKKTYFELSYYLVLCLFFANNLS